MESINIFGYLGRFSRDPTEVWLNEANNLFNSTKCCLFCYDLVESKKYFSWARQILLNSIKNFALLDKLFCLDQLYFYGCIRCKKLREVPTL